MQKTNYILILLLLISMSCFAQKVTQQTLSIYEIEEIRIDTDKIFQLNIFSTNDNIIKIETRMEGEYFRDLNIITATKNKQVLLSCELAEDFELPNDKLSAHKVFSVAMNIYIPKQLKVQLEGDGTQVYVKGNYKKFLALLISGNYTLEDFYSEAKIQTKKGNIHYIKQKLPVFETETDQQTIFYEKGKKVELKTDNGKITYSSNKD
jgi:plasmid maintenance system killer protein